MGGREGGEELPCAMLSVSSTFRGAGGGRRLGYPYGEHSPGCWTAPLVFAPTSSDVFLVL